MLPFFRHLSVRRSYSYGFESLAAVNKPREAVQGRCLFPYIAKWFKDHHRFFRLLRPFMCEEPPLLRVESSDQTVGPPTELEFPEYKR